MLVDPRFDFLFFVIGHNAALGQAKVQRSFWGQLGSNELERLANRRKPVASQHVVEVVDVAEIITVVEVDHVNVAKIIRS